MKVTVSFADTKVVVPCGDGGIPVRALAEMAICRFRKSIGANFNVSIVDLLLLKIVDYFFAVGFFH